MSSDIVIPKNNMAGNPDITDKDAGQTNARLGSEIKDIERIEQRSKLSSVRRANTFIKPTLKGTQTEETRPLPWPMPPRSHGKEPEEESSATTSENRDTDREYLTPQSSFAHGAADSSSQTGSLPVPMQSREGSGSYSRESSVKRESFSSVGTGFSLASVDSSDSASSESVSKVDIDADEFAHFLTEKTKSSQSTVDYGKLFAEEVQERRLTENDNSSANKTKGLSEFSENSTPPKASRAPFRHLKTTKADRNTVSLEEALDFSPDYKTVGTENGPLFREERTGSEERKVLVVGNQEVTSEHSRKEYYEESVVRRPMASRQKTFLVLPTQRDAASSIGDVSENASNTETNFPTEKNITQEEGQLRHVVETAQPVKGVIMRAQSHVSHVAGIRRAETGRIMSRAELRAQKPVVFQESPNPKSLNPAGFPGEEEDVDTIHPSAIFPGANADNDNAVSLKTSAAAEQPVEKKQHSSGNLSGTRVDDGSFLSPGILSRKKKFGTEEYKVDSFQFSEHEGSSGLLNRFSSGFRKMHLAVAKKSATHEGQGADSAITIPGTIDEAVCKICVVCRKQLECDVYVKDTGKKIKVESRKDGNSGYLRATILVRQKPGEQSKCEVYIRQSRSDGMKTSLATLWSFYQRLEAGLKEMG